MNLLRVRMRSFGATLSALMIASLLPAQVAPAAVAARRVATATGTPVDAVAADVTGDGIRDIVEALSETGLVLRAGRAGDIFGPATTLAADIRANRVLARDMNGDGRADVVAYREGGSSVWVVPSNRKGGFGEVREQAVQGGIRGIAFGDFDRSGADDIAVAAGEATISLLMTRDDRGGFDVEEATPHALALSVASADFDRDGWSDLAVGTAAGAVAILANRDGAFVLASTRSTGFSADFVATDDLDNDGWFDVVAASRTGQVATLRNVDGQPGDGVASSLGTDIERFALGLVDRDATPDVVALSRGTAVVASGIENGSFAAARAATLESGVTGLSLVQNGAHSDMVISRPAGTKITAAIDVAKKSGTAESPGVVTYTVTSTADANTIPGPPGSLRLAVQQANADSVASRIIFNIPTTDPNFDIVELFWTIDIVAPLDLTDDATEIDATTQPDTNPYGPEIQLQGGTGYDCFVIPADACEVYGLSITGFRNAFTIDGERNTLQRNYIGVDPLGRAGGGGGTGPGPVGTLECGIPESGDLTATDPAPTGFPNRYSDTYTFSGVAGQQVTITVTSGGGFQPFLRVFGPPGNQVAEDQNVDNDNVAQVVFTLPLTGTYTVVVTSTADFATGTYSIALACSGTVGNSNLRNGTAVFLGGNNNFIGGGGQLDFNVISNNDDGVRILQASGNQITNNIIGVDTSVAGAGGGGSNLRGIFVFTGSGTIITGNVIAGNDREGVLVDFGSSATSITNNNIGANRTGVPSTGNGFGGVVVNVSSGTTINNNRLFNNGAAAGLPLDVFGAISLTGTTSPTTGTTIAGNSIDNNAGAGVGIQFATGTTVGPTNEISDNTVGVLVVQGSGNVISRNSIHDNVRLGIDLVSSSDQPSGVTLNDPTDSDNGPNGLLNYPVFNTLTVVPSTGAVSVAGTAPANSRVEVFRSDLDPSGFGEGETYLTAIDVGPSGTFSVSLPVTLPVEPTFAITGTATRSEGTSEFGPNFAIGRRAEVGPTSVGFGILTTGTVTTQTVEICNRGASDLTVGGVSIECTGGGGPFSVSAVPAEGAVLSPGECTTVTVTFTPTSVGNFSCELVVATDDPINPEIRIPITGRAVEPSASAPGGKILFPVTRLGRSSSRTITITNTAEGAIQVSGAVITRKEPKNGSIVYVDDVDDLFWSISPASATIGRGETATFTVTFSPDFPLLDETLAPNKDVYTFPSPDYHLPEKVKSRLRFSINGGLVFADVNLVGRVSDEPWIRDGVCRISSDRVNTRMRTYDADGNYANARWVFYNEADVEILRVNETPTLASKTEKFPKGVLLDLQFEFLNMENYTPSIAYFDVNLVDADGQVSNTGRCEPDRKSGGSSIGPRPAEVVRIDLGSGRE